MKRKLWVLAMLAGVVLFAGLAIVMVAGVPIGDGRVIYSRGIWPIISVLTAGACAAGIFMKPREFREAMRPVEPEVKEAAWLAEFRRDRPPER
ncbi:MAG TPA: hypothetical protein VEA80_19770 [Vitreimonas sp.]|uniref:hypothetical protein n=1 Tax=Vitreimonas sp. TaxID=3069702 RepID=UPI002D5EBF38|nr:hypothetical protein [Vitreimonas sp.]HYD89730.1 hypothetical protein [Vitreimonas sp.]